MSIENHDLYVELSDGPRLARRALVHINSLRHALAQSEQENAALRAERDKYKELLPQIASAIEVGEAENKALQSRLEEVLELLNEVAGYTRHPDYDWHISVQRYVDRMLKQPSGVSGAGGSAEHCWSCRKPFTKSQWLEADGNCPHCNVEVEHEHE